MNNIISTLVEDNNFNNKDNKILDKNYEKFNNQNKRIEVNHTE